MNEGENQSRDEAAGVAATALSAIVAWLAWGRAEALFGEPIAWATAVLAFVICIYTILAVYAKAAGIEVEDGQV